MTGISKPKLIIKEITDKYLQKNFQKLGEYFATQNQLQDFTFLEITSDKPVTDLKVAHNLGFIPKDFVKSRLTGTGSITLSYSKWDEQFIYISSTGPFRLRCYVGTYWNDQSTTATAKEDVDILSAPAAGIPTGMMIDMISNTAPDGFLALDGSVVNIADYQNLYDFWKNQGLSFNTGGEKSTEFRLPDSTRKTTVGAGGTASSTLGNKVGDTGGEESHTLSANESGLPTHTHADAGHNHGASHTQDLNPGVTFTGMTNVQGGSGSSVVTAVNFAQIQAVAAAPASQAHNNIQPSFVALKCVKY